MQSSGACGSADIDAKLFGDLLVNFLLVRRQILELQHRRLELERVVCPVELELGTGFEPEEL